MKIVLTGASGFLGHELVRHWRGRDIELKALVVGGRGGGAVPLIQACVSPAATVEELGDALAGADALVHLAGLAHVASRLPSERFRSVNTDLTQRLAMAASLRKLSAMVFASSVRAVGDRNSVAWNEDVIPSPREAYGASKLAAEHEIERIGSETGLATVSLRLPLMYGLGMKGNMRRLFEAVARGTPLPLGAIANRRSFLYSGNFVAALDAVLAARLEGQKTFFLSDDEDVSTSDLVRVIGAAMKRRPRLLPLGPVLAGLQWGAELCRAEVLAAHLRRLTGSLTVDISRIRAATGYRPVFSMLDGMTAISQASEA